VTIDSLRARFGDGLDRLEQMLDERARDVVRPSSDPLQRPTLLHVPGLSVRPWHEAAQWPWTRDFEAAAPVVLEEFLAIEAAGAGVDSWEDYGDGWGSWALYKNGEWNPETTPLAPATTALLRRTDYTREEFFFSEIAAGGFIPFHTGGCNAVFSCHLPLILAPNCGIRVGTVTRHWQFGKVLVFDDSYVHGCWNESEQRRIVLVWEIWHPELSAVEREAMAWIYDGLVNAPGTEMA